MKTEPKPIIVKKSVKHTFSPAELAQLNVDFGNAYDAVNSAEADFDAVKSVHKAKIAEAQSRMTTLRATINAGFEMRVKEVIVTYRPKDGKKDFWLEIANTDASIPPERKLQLTEDMTREDYVQELFEAERIFSGQKTVTLWSAATDNGAVVLGRLNGKWYGAVRGNVGKKTVTERLDSMQRAFTKRAECFQAACARAKVWLKENVGKDFVKGFEDGIDKAVLAEKDKEE